LFYFWASSLAMRTGGSGAKKPRAGIYSEHGDCALLQRPSGLERKSFSDIRSARQYIQPLGAGFLVDYSLV
jgi:hypothetical protein